MKKYHTYISFDDGSVVHESFTNKRAMIRWVRNQPDNFKHAVSLRDGIVLAVLLDEKEK